MMSEVRAKLEDICFACKKFQVLQVRDLTAPSHNTSIVRGEQLVTDDPGLDSSMFMEHCVAGLGQWRPDKILRLI